MVHGEISRRLVKGCTCRSHGRRLSHRALWWLWAREVQAGLVCTASRWELGAGSQKPQHCMFRRAVLGWLQIVFGSLTELTSTWTEVPIWSSNWASRYVWLYLRGAEFWNKYKFWWKKKSQSFEMVTISFLSWNLERLHLNQMALYPQTMKALGLT